jgi:MerR family transcriptional regulator/heat shock protein HspR
MQPRTDDEAPLFVISVAAQLSGMHAQTLRQYDRLGLVSPQRTRGGGRRYSARDIARLREVQQLSQEEGVSLAGIQRILELEDRVASLRARLTEVTARLAAAEGALGLGGRVFAAGSRGDIVAVRPGERPPRVMPGSRAVALWRPLR